MIEEHRLASRFAHPEHDALTSRVLLLGEHNPQSDDPIHALWPDPPGCAGHRLQSQILRVSSSLYRCYWRTNLCLATWDSKDAYLRAWELVQPDCPWSVIVLLGRKVEKVMRMCGEVSFYEHRDVVVGEKSLRLVSIPHPSGVCREWNDPESYTRATGVLYASGVLPP